MELKDRFLKYVSYDTQSSEQSRTFPSTDKQLVLLRELADEMKALEMTEVTMDAHGYVMGTVPATPGCEKSPVVILQSHMDMVCEKNSDVTFDFDNDPIRTHSKRRADQITDTDFLCSLSIGISCLQPHQIWHILKLKFCRIFNRDHPICLWNIGR